jgi:hypothetical protein
VSDWAFAVIPARIKPHRTIQALRIVLIPWIREMGMRIF